jgi:hypothetical protein
MNLLQASIASNMNQDTEHLRLLSIFHYVLAGMTALFSSFGFIHLTLGLMMLFSSRLGSPGHDRPPPEIGLIFALAGGAVIVGGWSLATAMFVAGRSLKKRRRYLFCMVVAALSCMFTPFGTILGIFTIMVLMRPSVKALFDAQATNRAGQGWEAALPHPSYQTYQTDQAGMRKEKEEARPRQPPDWR